MRLLLVVALAALAGCAAQAPSSAPVATGTVTIPGAWVFEPAQAQVKAGATVTFVNHGGQDHTVTLDDGSADFVVPAGGSATHVFATPGTYGYHCKFHPPGMKGTIVVVAA